MVHINEVTDLTDQMMKVNIFPSSEKLRMLKDEDRTFLDPNVIMDTRHRILRESFSTLRKNASVWVETKKLLKQEETAQLYTKKQHRFLERELKIFEMELSKARPKFLKSYACSRRNLAPSDDEDFWRTSRKFKRKTIVEERSVQSGSCEGNRAQTKTDVRSLKGEDEKHLKTTISEVPCIGIGSIKVTIKDKNNIDTDAERLHLLRKYLDIFKRNVVEEQRLRETKMKIQLNMSAKIMRKYFDIWRTHTKDARDSAKKQEGEICEERRIEMFINAITKRQRDLMKGQKPRRTDGNVRVAKKSNDAKTKRQSTCRKSIVIESPAQSRLNAQKKIIEKQKAKLVEQNRIIEELKLKQMQKDISKANKETVDTAKETLTYCGEKTRRTLIRLMRHNGYRDENFTVNRRSSEPPKFLSRMEARAEARRKRVKLLEELRRQQLDEEKRKEDAARTEEEQNKRRLQQEALAEARKLRKEQEERRWRTVEKIQRLNAIADGFYRKYLLRRYILKAFVTLIEHKKIDMQKAEDHCREKLSKKIFTKWKVEVKTQCEIKDGIALAFYKTNLTAQMFERWKKATKEVNSKYQVAVDFYDMKLLDKYFKLWIVRVDDIKAECEEKANLADSMWENKLKANYFGKWKKYIAIVEDIKASERRRDELRQLVQKVIPDFNPKQRGVALGD